MNHVYRVIWNGSAACWQAVSEAARGKSKSGKSTNTSPAKLLKQLALVSGVAASMAVSGVAMAAPNLNAIVSGVSSIGVSGSTTTVNQNASKAIINWNDFSIGSGETVNFVQPDANAIALNRVVTTAPSSIQGALNANGQVFIVNPNGITFGSTAQVNVGGLVASTLDISDSDFNNGTYRFANTASNASIINEANIAVADAGTAALIAPSIQQAGSIVNNDGSILLTAASDVTLSLTNRVLNSQTINAGHSTATINNSAGTIQADGGKVILTAQGVNSSSTASISSAGTIRAQTLAGNDRGVIDLIADSASGVVNLTGALDASAPTNGFGGTIRTIGADVAVANSASVTTRKVNQTNLPGTSSYWQIKANSINVGSGGTISGSELSSSLNDGSVTLTASGTGTGQGNININDAVSTNSNVILSLAATKDINFNNNVGLTANLGRLILGYGSSNDYNLNNGSKITLSGAGATLRINNTDYTVIHDVTQLQAVNNNLTGKYVLGNDIDASITSTWNSGAGFAPIGDGSAVVLNGSVPDLTGIGFRGVFDGLGHQIDQVFINRPTTNFVGVFGIAHNSLVQNISIVNSSVTGNALVGGLMGANAGIQGNAIIKNSHVINSNVTGHMHTGGLAGGNSGTDSTASVFNSSAQSITVEATEVVGGLIGYNQGYGGDVNVINSFSSGIVRNTSGYQASAVGGLIGRHSVHFDATSNLTGSYSTATVSGYRNIGGLLGDAAVEGSAVMNISNSYAHGSVSGEDQIGGLIGTILNGLPGVEPVVQDGVISLSNSYSTGSVVSNQSSGGLIGANNINGTGTTTVSNSYWDTTSSGQSTSAGGTGKTTAELKQIATFSGWNIADVSNTTSSSIWVIDENNATPWLR